MQQAYEATSCHFCKSDIKLVLDAARDLEQIAGFAEGLTDHPHRLKALRVLGANLDKIHMLSALVLLSRNRLISKLLKM